MSDDKSVCAHPECSCDQAVGFRRGQQWAIAVLRERSAVEESKPLAKRDLTMLSLIIPAVEILEANMKDTT